MKVVKSLENREILLKRTTGNIIIHEWAFLNFIRLLMTAGLPLIKSILTSLAKSVLLPIWLSAGILAGGASVQKKIYGWETTVIITSNEKMEDMIKIVKSLEESRILIKGISENIKQKKKNKKESFFQRY